MTTHNPLRRLSVVVTAVVLGVVVSVVAASPAHASGSGTIYRAPGTSYGYYNYQDHSTASYLRLLAWPTTLASGKCYDTWFDWTRTVIAGSNHYDARVARSCRSNANRDTGTNAESNYVHSYNKLGVCYGNNNATTSPISNCTSTSVSGVVPSLPNMCTRAWWLTSGGVVNYHAGGSSTSCSS